MGHYTLITCNNVHHTHKRMSENVLWSFAFDCWLLWSCPIVFPRVELCRTPWTPKAKCTFLASCPNLRGSSISFQRLMFFFSPGLAKMNKVKRFAESDVKIWHLWLDLWTCAFDLIHSCAMPFFKAVTLDTCASRNWNVPQRVNHVEFHQNPGKNMMKSHAKPQQVVSDSYSKFVNYPVTMKKCKHVHYHFYYTFWGLFANSLCPYNMFVTCFLQDTPRIMNWRFYNFYHSLFYVLLKLACVTIRGWFSLPWLLRAELGITTCSQLKKKINK